MDRCTGTPSPTSTARSSKSLLCLGVPDDVAPRLERPVLASPSPAADEVRARHWKPADMCAMFSFHILDLPKFPLGPSREATRSSSGRPRQRPSTLTASSCRKPCASADPDEGPPVRHADGGSEQAAGEELRRGPHGVEQGFKFRQDKDAKAYYDHAIVCAQHRSIADDLVAGLSGKQRARLARQASPPASAPSCRAGRRAQRPR